MADRMSDNALRAARRVLIWQENHHGNGRHRQSGVVADEICRQVAGGMKHPAGRGRGGPSHRGAEGGTNRRGGCRFDEQGTFGRDGGQFCRAGFIRPERIAVRPDKEPPAGRGRKFAGDVSGREDMGFSGGTHPHRSSLSVPANEIARAVGEPKSVRTEPDESPGSLFAAMSGRSGGTGN